MFEIQKWNIPNPLSGGTVDTGEKEKQYKDKHFTRQSMKDMAAIGDRYFQRGRYFRELLEGFQTCRYFQGQLLTGVAIFRII